MASITHSVEASTSQLPQDPQYYRSLIKRVRPHAKFKIPMPSGGDFEFSYDLRVGKPLLNAPIVEDYPGDAGRNIIFRNFFDKIFLEDGSTLHLGGEEVPLTCIFVRGQDNRLAKSTPLLPDIILQFYLVANDYSCTGPINPGWPENGQKKETWDTYLRFDVRDPTVMLPVETSLRYRWNQFSAVLIDSGPTSLSSATLSEQGGILP
jgi:hypothetical protein